MNYLLKINLVRNDITSISGGSARWNIGQDSLERVSIFISKIIEKQQKIAVFLTAVDTKITKVDQQIKKMNQFKKGLLQQMFV